MNVQKISCRIEELTFLALFILDSFIRDKADFIALSPKYKDPFTANANAQIALVEDLINPKKLTGELKKLTQKLRDGFTHCRNLLNKLERYLDMAAQENLSLTMVPADFGIKAIRENVNLKNDEGVVLKLRSLQQKLDDNTTVLATVGYTEEVKTELTNLIKDLSDTSVAQTRKKKEREALVSKNMDQLYKLWSIIVDLMKSGKTISKEQKDRNKLDDYTYSKVIRDVQLKRKQQEEEEGNTSTAA